MGHSEEAKDFKRMAKGTAAAKSSAPAKASGLWIMLEDDSSREEGSCAQNYSGFRHLHETGGSQDLMKKHLVITAPGAGSQFRWYGVIVRDYDELRPDKVGIFDSTLLLNSVERGWLGDMLHKHVKTLSRPNSKIFSFSSGDFRKTVSEVGEELGVDSIHPYQLRHGGASDNLNAKSRDYLAVKARGRWSTDQRVRRYGKV